MKILIRPKEFTGDTQWVRKHEGVILVEKEEDIEPLWKLLCEQDEYWESYKKIIKVAPKEIDDISEIINMCQYAGKTDIYHPEKIKEIIPFIMYQKRNYSEWLQ
jgi:hypothetical protein